MKEKNNNSEGIQKLWAPWRMKYIEEIGIDKNENCIFCDKPSLNKDENSFILHRGKTCLAT